VLRDLARERPIGKTHTLDCRWAETVSDKPRVPGTDYVVKDVAAIPPATPRCSYCGGGRR